MKKKFLLLITFISVIIGSCTKDVVEPNYTPIVPNTNAKFSTDVYPLFASNSCTSCHGTSGGLDLSGAIATVRTNLLTVGSVKPNQASTSKLYYYFNNATHQGKALNATQISNIKGWIDAGALDN
jgi:hypothetical protein